MAEYYEYGLIGLFAVCFVASTLYPLGSEVFVVGFVAVGFEPFVVWAVASLGNTLGSLSTYYLAYFGGYKMIMRFFPKAWENISTLAPKIQKIWFCVCVFCVFAFCGGYFCSSSWACAV